MRVSKAISKRKPRQNIIAMILGSAKKKGSHSSGSDGESRHRSPSKSSTKLSRSSSKTPPSSHSTDRSSSKEGNRRNKQLRILASAVELTRRSKARSTSSRGVQFFKGQKAFYRSSKGINKVTVVGIHHDSKLEPYYTIRLRDGKEKQTDGKHLVPIQEDPPSRGNAKSSTDGSSSKRPHSSSEVMTDHMSTSSSEPENEQPQQHQTPPPVGISPSHEETEAEPDVEAHSEDAGSDEDVFRRGQDAYYRASDGNVLKVRVLEVYGSSNPAYEKGHRYCISMADGRRKDAKGSQLATLMDLTSMELAVLMKEKNDRQHSNSSVTSRDHHNHRRSSLRQSRGELASSACSAQTHDILHEEPQETLALPPPEDDVVDEGYEPSTENSDSSQEGVEDGKEPKILALPCTVPMVEAKTEDGGTKIVPRYPADMEVFYKGPQGIVEAIILGSHLDDLLDPYYTIRLEDGREKQTDNAHITLTREEVHDLVPVNPQPADEQCEESLHAKIPDEGGVNEESSKEEEQSGGLDQALVVAEKKDPSDDIEEFAHEPPGKKQDPSASAIVAAFKFSIGDEVLYNSSQGDHLNAVIVKLQKDKKHRPYYVVKISGGKEKQVYGHRLSPLAKSSERPRRSRSRSCTRRDRSNSVRDASVESRKSKKSLTRENSVDSRRSRGSSLRRSRENSVDSRRSQESRERRRSSSKVSRRESDRHGERRHNERSRSLAPEHKHRPTTPSVSYSSRLHSGDEKSTSSKIGNFKKSFRVGRAKSSVNP